MEAFWAQPGIADQGDTPGARFRVLEGCSIHCQTRRGGGGLSSAGGNVEDEGRYGLNCISPNSHVEVPTLSTSEYDSIWRHGL